MATYLRIPYENSAARENAKKAGAKWQANLKVWKLDGDCPESLAEFKAEVERATYTISSLLLERFARTSSLLDAAYQQAEEFPDKDEPLWRVKEIVGDTPLYEGFPNKKELESLARQLAATLLIRTGQRDLAKQIEKVK